MIKYIITIFKRKEETQVIKLRNIKCPSSRAKHYLMNTRFKRDILKF